MRSPKIYSVVVGDQIVFRGSYSVALKVFSAVESLRSSLGDALPVVSIMFVPNLNSERS